MPFEKYERPGRGGTEKSKISIRKSGSIGINNTALEEFFDEDDGAVVMYYDKEEKEVGIRAVEDKDADDDAYTLSRTESGGAVTPSGFLRDHDLKPDRTEQYNPRKVKQNQNTELVVFQVGGKDSEDFHAFYGPPPEEEDEEDESDD